MILKISNIRKPETFEQLYQYNADYITINLNQKSPNYIGEIDPAILSVVPENVKRCGRFDTANTMQIISKAGRYNLDAVELEGNEATPTLCEQLAAEGIEVIKIIAQEQLHTIPKFEGLCNKYIFQNVPIKYLEIYKGSTPIMITITKNEFLKMSETPMWSENDQLFAKKLIVGYDINFNE